MRATWWASRTPTAPSSPRPPRSPWWSSCQRSAPRTRYRAGTRNGGGRQLAGGRPACSLVAQATRLVAAPPNGVPPVAHTRLTVSRRAAPCAWARAARCCRQSTAWPPSCTRKRSTLTSGTGTGALPPRCLRAASSLLKRPARRHQRKPLAALLTTHQPSLRVCVHVRAQVRGEPRCGVQARGGRAHIRGARRDGRAHGDPRAGQQPRGPPLLRGLPVPPRVQEQVRAPLLWLGGWLEL